MKKFIIFIEFLSFIFFTHATVFGRGISVNNIKTVFNGTQTNISFNLAWKDSWRVASEPANWDAAWIFAKYRMRKDSAGPWRHATLGNEAENYNLNKSNSIPATIQPGQDGKGFLIYRAREGKGDVQWQNVSVPWDVASDNVRHDSDVEVSVFALEMIYIPEGPFYVGDGVSQGTFYAGGRPDSPFLIDAGPIHLKNSEGSLWADESQGDLPGGMKAPAAWDEPAGDLSPRYPSGYKPFYIMKYEITQGQYTEFLNSLGRAQAVRRYPAEGTGKFRFTTAFGQKDRYVTSTPTRACNWLNWEDGIAFADWAALRPMTELEFEKACRGKGPSVAGEYAWGTTKIISMTSISGKDGSGTEKALPENANTLYLKTIMGPVRVGIFEGNKTRELAGSSYYSVSDLSGNVIEMAVTIGNSAGRQFTGKHGDGELAQNGDADVSLWPRVGASPLVAATRIEEGGFGYRGGDFYNPEADLRVSDRHVATFHSGRRLLGLGFRAVRSDF